MLVKGCVHKGLHLFLAAENFSQQTLGFPLQRQNVGPYFFQCAHRLRLVEVPSEADFVADLDAGGVVPRVRCVGKYLSAQEALDTALFEERHLLGVAQVAVGFVLDDPSPAVDSRFNQTTYRVGFDVSRTMDFLYDGLGGLFA